MSLIEETVLSIPNMAVFSLILLGMKSHSLLLQDFMALLAYEEPEKSPVFHLLGLEYRQHVADKLNRAILGWFRHLFPCSMFFPEDSLLINVLVVDLMLLLITIIDTLYIFIGHE